LAKAATITKVGNCRDEHGKREVIYKTLFLLNIFKALRIIVRMEKVGIIPAELNPETSTAFLQSD
jgi:hypothetical protein